MVNNLLTFVVTRWSTVQGLYFNSEEQNTEMTPYAIARLHYKTVYIVYYAL